jgi:hypothetical protein
LWVATDDGSGELADFISLDLDEDETRVRLYHCKGAGGPAPGQRVGDLYEVVGQAIKCVPWTLVPASLWSQTSVQPSSLTRALARADSSQFNTGIAFSFSRRASRERFERLRILAE